jgi:hypothetical protein
MSTKTLGTSATNSLTALAFAPGVMAAADTATIAQAIKGQNAVGRNVPEAFSGNGLLHLPEKKGIIRLDPGDWVGVDPATGWPVVISAYAIANGAFTHN